ncbi:MAG: hypothetical protein Q8Q65_02040 [bacterium]|nr:hypothetical protein [bacterium]
MKRLLPIILIIISGIFLKPQAVLANIPGAATGTVKVELPDGTRMALPNVRIYRTDYWAYSYCPNGQPCFGDKDGVEVIVKTDGTYYMGNDGNSPGPVCVYPDSGATVCPAGEKGKIDHSTSDNDAPLQACSDPAAQVARNWCGLNCGSNPHRLEPYFPDGVGLPGGLETLGYSKDKGHWVGPQGGPIYEEGWGNDFTRNNIDFIFKLDTAQLLICNQICDPNGGISCNTAIGEVCTLVNPGHSPILPDENRCRLQTYPNSLTCESPQCGDTCDPTNPICPLECPSCQPDGNGPNVCQPPATPTPTPTATPTATPTPTLPPQCGSPCNPAEPLCPNECPVCLPGNGGGNTCQPPPTPTPPLSACHCDGINITAPDPKIVKKGETVEFTIFAYTDPYGNPASYPTKVTRIIYSIYKDNVRVAGPIETIAALVGIQTREGKQVEVYKVDGTYTIPNLDSAIGVYKIDATNGNETNGLFCKLKHLAYATEIRVAQASSRQNIFARFFNWLIGRSNSNEAVTGQNQNIPNVNYLIPDGDSLQLGTFYPVDELPQDGCTFANFQVPSLGFLGE